MPTGERWVVERLGKFSRTLDAGTHGKWPLIESVRSRLEVGPGVQEVQLSNVETADGARLSVTLRLELVRFVRESLPKLHAFSRFTCLATYPLHFLLVFSSSFSYSSYPHRLAAQEIVDAAAATYNVAIVADDPGDADSVYSDDAVAAVAESHAVAARASLSRHSREALRALQGGDALLDDADAEALRAQAAKWGIKIIGVTHGALALFVHLWMHCILHVQGLIRAHSQFCLSLISMRRDCIRPRTRVGK